MTDHLERSLRRSLAVIEDLERRLARGQEDVAVIGLACRFPGAGDSQTYWALLRDGVDAVGEIPADRWDVDRYFDPDPDHPGTMYSRRGGFIDDVFGFDHALFGMSPREAARTDPQHRLLLEVSWEAIEHAGIAPSALRGSDTGVFLGIAENDYAKVVDAHNARHGRVDPYDATGTGACFASGRISHVLGLHGPNIAVDTGCSSALVALHHAVAALRSGECGIALAAGVHLRLAPETTLALSATSALAPDGRCKPFGAAADGFGRSEGAGVIVLKRLSDARRDGDPVLAVVRGSAVNHDGPASGLTAPSERAQIMVVRAALAAARVRADEVGVVEAHGTGTILGDPIEVAALAEVFAGTRAPIWLGSVKSNIGHTEGAAGIASIIKIVLALGHRTVPPTLHGTPGNPHIPWDDLPFRVPQSITSWPQDRPYAGVSSFGMSGTNAHVVLGPPPVPVAASPDANESDANEPDANQSEGKPRLVLLSARSPKALAHTANRFAAALAVAAGAPARHELDQTGGPTVDDLCLTANTGRTCFVHRLAVVAGRDESMAAAIRERLKGTLPAPARRGRRLAMMFTGQGSTWPLMGAQLHRTSAVFRAAFDEVADQVRQAGGPDLHDLVLRGAGDLVRTDVAQPAIFAIEVALAELWKSWGLVPDLVLGHSVGEVAAATVAGIFRPGDAARFVVERGRLMHALPAGGGMTAVRCDEARARAAIAGLEAVAIAAVNGCEDVVVSGPLVALAVAEERFGAAGVRTTRLSVSHAFHSPLMRPVLDDVVALAAASSLRAARIPLVDNVTAGVEATTLADPAYYGRHLMGTVRFAASIDRALALGIDTFLEIGPKPVLAAQVRQSIQDGDASGGPLILASMRQGAEWVALLAAAAALVESGVDLDLGQVSPAGRRVAAPTYPFEHTEHRIPPSPHRPATVDGVFTSLVSVPGTAAVVGEAALTAEVADLTDHRIDGRVVVPAALHVALFVDLVTSGGAVHDVRLDDVVFPAPLVIDAQSVPVVAALLPSGAGGELTCSTVDPRSDSTTVHAVARLSEPGDGSGASSELGSWVDLTDSRLEDAGAEAVYDRLDGSALQLGPAYRRLTRLRRAPGIVVGDLDLDRVGTTGHRSGRGHPGALDAAFQLVEALREDDDLSLRLPFRIDHLALRHDALLTARHAIADRLGDEVRIRLLDASATVTLVGRGFVDAQAPERGVDPVREGWLLQPSWTTVDAPSGSSEAVALLGEGPDARYLAEALGGRGVTVTVLGGVETVDSAVLAGHPASTLLVVEESGQASPAPAVGRLARLVSRLGELVNPPRVRLVTRTDGNHLANQRLSALLALARAAAFEHPEVDCRCVAIDGVDDVAAAWLTSLQPGLPDVIVEQGVGVRAAHDLLRNVGIPMPRCLALTSFDGPDALSLRPGRAPTPGAGEVRIDVVASGLNFRDVLISLGMLREDCGGSTQDAQQELLGFECAGIVAEVGPAVTGLRVGDRVAALGEGTHADQVVVPASHAVLVPPQIDLVVAAAMPMAFLTATHAFERAGGVHPGSTVLIHAVTGGVGQAAARLALAAGARVYGTASSAKRAAALALGITDVFDSRSTTFADDLLRATGQRGADVVLNSLAGPAIDAGLRCVAVGGTFVEIGRVGSWDHEQVADVRPDIGYVKFDLGDEAAADPSLVRRLLAPVLNEVAEGRLAPLTLRAFALEESAEAFGLMQRARHVGKVVLTADGVGRPRVVGGAVLISGGLGALGLHAAAVLAERGVDRLVLLGRGAPSVTAQTHLDELRALGVEVLVIQGDVTSEDDVRDALHRATAGGMRLAGVVHAAGVLDDGLLGRLDEDRINRVVAPKVAGAAVLDRLTRPWRPDFFVMFSSIAAHTATGGQGAYAAANAWLDGTARVRRAEGLPALSVAWGPWSGPGMAAHGNFERTIPVDTGREILGRLLDAGLGAPPVVVVDVERLLAPPTTQKAHVRGRPGGAREAIARLLAELAPSRRREAMIEHLGAVVCGLTGLHQVQSLDETSTLAEIGVDSLMLVEIRRTLSRDLGVAVSASLVFDHPTLGTLAEALLGLVDAAPDPDQALDTDGVRHPRSGAPQDASAAPQDAEELRRLLDLELDDAAEDR